MAFTTCTITHKFENADGTAASGSLTFALTKRITNGTVSIVPAAEITATLDVGGNLSQALTSNLDPATTPADSQWRVDVRVAGAALESYYITVPAGGGSVDLGSLLPSAQQVG